MKEFQFYGPPVQGRDPEKKRGNRTVAKRRPKQEYMSVQEGRKHNTDEDPILLCYIYVEIALHFFWSATVS